MEQKTLRALLLCVALLLLANIPPGRSVSSASSKPDASPRSVGPLVSQIDPLEAHYAHLPLVPRELPSYAFLRSWGNEIGVFHEPKGIAVGGDRVYVCDTSSDRIQVFDLHGLPLMTFGETVSQADDLADNNDRRWFESGFPNPFDNIAECPPDGLLPGRGAPSHQSDGRVRRHAVRLQLFGDVGQVFNPHQEDDGADAFGDGRPVDTGGFPFSDLHGR